MSAAPTAADRRARPRRRPARRRSGGPPARSGTQRAAPGRRCIRILSSSVSPTRRNNAITCYCLVQGDRCQEQHLATRHQHTRTTLVSTNKTITPSRDRVDFGKVRRVRRHVATPCITDRGAQPTICSASPERNSHSLSEESRAQHRWFRRGDPASAMRARHRWCRRGGTAAASTSIARIPTPVKHTA